MSNHYANICLFRAKEDSWFGPELDNLPRPPADGGANEIGLGREGASLIPTLSHAPGSEDPAVDCADGERSWTRGTGSARRRHISPASVFLVILEVCETQSGDANVTAGPRSRKHLGYRLRVYGNTLRRGHRVEYATASIVNNR